MYACAYAAECCKCFQAQQLAVIRARHDSWQQATGKKGSVGTWKKPETQLVVQLNSTAHSSGCSWQAPLSVVYVINNILFCADLRFHFTFTTAGAMRHTFEEMLLVFTSFHSHIHAYIQYDKWCTLTITNNCRCYINLQNFISCSFAVSFSTLYLIVFVMWKQCKRSA